MPRVTRSEAEWRENTLESIAKPIWRRRWIAVTAVAAVVAACGLTEARVQRKPKSYDWLPTPESFGQWKVSQETAAGPIITRAYPIPQVLETFQKSFDGEKGAEVMLCSLVERIASPLQAAAKTPFTTTASDTVRLEDGTLLVSAPQSAHEELGNVLSAWETTGIDQICVECRIVTCDRDLATESKIAWRYFDGSGAADTPVPDRQGDSAIVSARMIVENAVPVCSTTLNDRQSHQFVKLAQGDRSSNIMFTPKITLFNASAATVSSQLQQPYVVGFRQTETGQRESVTKLAEEGLKLNVRPTLSADRRTIRLNGWLENSNILDVIPVSVSTEDGPATLQFPRVNRCRIDLASDVPVGETLLVGCVPSYERKKFLYVMLTPKVVTP